VLQCVAVYFRELKCDAMSLHDFIAKLASLQSQWVCIKYIHVYIDVRPRAEKASLQR